MKQAFNLEQPKKGNPESILNQAFEANRYLSLFDSRVIWVKSRKTPYIFDLREPYVLPLSAIVEKAYIQGFRVVGLDSNGWLLRCLVIPPDEREREDSLCDLTDQGLPSYLIDRIERI